MVGGREGSEGGVDRSRGGDEGEGLYSIDGKEGSDPRGGSISLWKRQRKRMRVSSKSAEGREERGRAWRGKEGGSSLVVRRRGGV